MRVKPGELCQELQNAIAGLGPDLWRLEYLSLDEDLRNWCLGKPWHQINMRSLLDIQQIRLLRSVDGQMESQDFLAVLENRPSEYENQLFKMRDAAVTASATTEMTTASQPRNSVEAFWRRLTSISIKNTSPVLECTPDHDVASSSLDIARRSLDLSEGGNDIDAFLEGVKKRYAVPGSAWQYWGRCEHGALSGLGYLAAVDMPRLIALAEKLIEERKQ